MTKKIEWIQDGPYTLAYSGTIVIGRYCKTDNELFELRLNLPECLSDSIELYSENKIKSFAQLTFDRWCEEAGLIADIQGVTRDQ